LYLLVGNKNPYKKVSIELFPNHGCNHSLSIAIPSCEHDTPAVTGVSIGAILRGDPQRAFLYLEERFGEI